MGLRTVIQGGVDRLINRGFTLDLGHVSESFADVDEFSAFLRARTGVSADTMSMIRDLSVDRLKRELAQTEATYKQMLETLLQVVERDSPVDILWRDLDISVLPDEQQWPAILFAVSSNNDLTDVMKRETVQCFVEYMRARKHLLRKAWSTRMEDTENSNQQSETVEIQLDVEGASRGAEQMADWPIADKGGDDVTIAARTQGRNYQRINRGERISISMADGERLPIYLSRWKIELVFVSGSLLVTEEGKQQTLPRGEHSTGRSSNCEVALPNAPLDVSRRHLVIVNNGEGHVILEDVSTKGTWIPREFIERN